MHGDMNVKSLCHPQGVIYLCLSKLHNFLKLNLLKLQFNKSIRLNYIKILFYQFVVK